MSDWTKISVVQDQYFSSVFLICLLEKEKVDFGISMYIYIYIFRKEAFKCESVIFFTIIFSLT